MLNPGERKKVLVTGANGLLGQKLGALILADPTLELIATVRRPVPGLFPGNLHLLDITSRRDAGEFISSHRPHVVVNTAAMTNVDQCAADPEGCWRTNADAVGYLVDACRMIDARLIQLSTDFVFNGLTGPLDETAKPDPVNYYGKSKVAAEELVAGSGLDWAIVRTVLVYGVTHDMSRSNIILWVRNSLVAGKEIQVVTDQWRTPTLAEDLASGCHRIIAQGARGIYHISGKDFMTPYDMAIATADYFGLDRKLIRPTDSSSFVQPARRPARTGFIIDKARRELGYEPVSFAEGIDIVARQLAMHRP